MAGRHEAGGGIGTISEAEGEKSLNGRGTNGGEEREMDEKIG